MKLLLELRKEEDGKCRVVPVEVDSEKLESLTMEQLWQILEAMKEAIKKP